MKLVGAFCVLPVAMVLGDDGLQVEELQVDGEQEVDVSGSMEVENSQRRRRCASSYLDVEDSQHLPDIPDVDVWVGWWGERKGAYKTSSLAFDFDKTGIDKDINKYGGGGLRFLYPAWHFFCEENETTGMCTLNDDYKDQWNCAVPKMKKLLKEGKIIGFSVGDERVCSHGKHGTDVGDLKKMIDTIRDSFPDRNKAIIHANECGGTFGDGDDCDDAAMKDVPSGLDWISVDKYRKDKKDSDFMDNLKKYYEKCIYPKMHSQQKVCITPGTTSEVCPDQETCLKDAKYTTNWAESSSHVGCITPYRWDDMDDLDDGKWSDLRDYWADYAQDTRPDDLAQMQNATLI